MSNSNLFSDLLAKPSASRSNVSSVNNNVDSINVNANFDKPGYLQSPEAFGGYWDSYEMGMTFEQAVERWESANTPEQRERVLADLKERAIQRADLDVRNGKIRFAMTEGADDWHGLGVRFKDNPTGFEMLLAAGLDEEVQKVLAEYSGASIDGVYLLGRPDDDGNVKPFPGVSVGKGYEVVQDSDVMEFMDEAFKTAGAKYSSAGSIHGGQTSFWCCELPESVEVVPGDEVKSFLTVHNSHGNGAVKAFGTNQRSVCANTHRQALAKNSESIRFRHTRNVKERMADAARAIEAQQLAFLDFGDAAKTMVRTQSNPHTFAGAVVDQLTDTDASYAKQFLSTQQRLAGVAGLAVEKDVTPEQVAGEFKRREKKTDSFIDSVLEKYNSETNTAPGTVWASFNSVTEHANHNLKYRTNDSNTARFESLLAGRAATITDAAMAVATNVCG